MSEVASKPKPKPKPSIVAPTATKTDTELKSVVVEPTSAPTSSTQSDTASSEATVSPSQLASLTLKELLPFDHSNPNNKDMVMAYFYKLFFDMAEHIGSPEPSSETLAEHMWRAAEHVKENLNSETRPYRSRPEYSLFSDEAQMRFLLLGAVHYLQKLTSDTREEIPDEIEQAFAAFKPALEELKQFKARETTAQRNEEIARLVFFGMAAAGFAITLVAIVAASSIIPYVALGLWLGAVAALGYGASKDNEACAMRLQANEFDRIGRVAAKEVTEHQLDLREEIEKAAPKPATDDTAKAKPTPATDDTAKAKPTPATDDTAKAKPTPATDDTAKAKPTPATDDTAKAKPTPKPATDDIETKASQAGLRLRKKITGLSSSNRWLQSPSSSRWAHNGSRGMQRITRDFSELSFGEQTSTLTEMAEKKPGSVPIRTLIMLR